MRTLLLVLRLFHSAAKIQRKRMVLTVMAITWGTISIILLLSFGEGLKRSLVEGSQGMGTGLLIVWPGKTSLDFAGLPQGRPIRLLAEDVTLLQQNIPEIASAAGEKVNWSLQLTRGRVSLNKRVVGTIPAYGEMRNQRPQPGSRFIDQPDQDQKRRVIFLGDKLKQELFGAAPAVGETLLVNQVPFTVIGVAEAKKQTSTYYGPDDDAAVMPMSTFEALTGRLYLNDLVLKPRTPELMPTVRRRIFEVLGGRYRFAADDQRALSYWDTVESQKVMRNIMAGLEIFLGVIGGLTLLIGGVGVANIMYAAVKHRTKEIGVEMALGARRLYVTGPLVLESLTLTAIGGVGGVAVGWGIVALLGWVQSKANSDALNFLGRPTFSPGVAAVTILLLGSIGFVAGYFPSRRAVSIQPAEALRYD
ncbi:MAG: ABC transporter permease [Acidobacteriota bacterium]